MKISVSNFLDLRYDAFENCFAVAEYLVRAIEVGALHYFEVNLPHFLVCNLKHEKYTFFCQKCLYVINFRIWHQ
jgi:hypothetical protein